MLRNGKFAAYAAALCVVCAMYGFLCAGLLGGHLTFLRASAGGPAARMDGALFAAALFCVPAAYFCGAALTWYGVRRTLILCAGLAGLGCIGVAAADGGEGPYALLCASVIVMRCAGVCLLMGTGTLCVRWFVRRRVPALAAVSLGIPLFCLLRPTLTALAIDRPGGDPRGLYLGAAAALAILAALTRVVLADWPEEAGLYPDGAGEAPDLAPEEISRLSAGEALRVRRAWLVVLLCAGLGFAAAAGRTAWITAAALYALAVLLPYAAARVYGRRDCAAGGGVAAALGLIPAAIAAHLARAASAGAADAAVAFAAALGVVCAFVLCRMPDAEDGGGSDR